MIQTQPNEPVFITREQPTQETFIGPSRPFTPPVTNPAVQAETFSEALRANPRDVLAELEGGGSQMLFWDAEEQLRALRRQQTEDYISRAAEGGIPAGIDEVAEETRQRVQREVVGSVAPDVALMLSNSNPDIDFIESRALERQVAAQRIIEEKLALTAAPESRFQTISDVATGAGYFIDQALSEGFHSALGPITSAVGIDYFEGGTRLNELAQEANALLYMDISNEEFTRRFTEILDRGSDLGFFTESNRFVLQQFAANIAQGGIGQESRMNTAFQAIDVGLTAIGAGVVRLGTRAGEAARNITKLTNNEAGEAVVLRNADELINDPVAAFPIAEDVVAESSSVSSIAPGREDWFTSPEEVIRRQLESENTILDMVRRGNWGEIVDPAVLATRMEVIRANTREAIRNSANHIMDYSVRQGDFNNLFGVAHMGTSKGTPYSSLRAAQTLADEVGGVVVPQTQAGKTVYTVQREVNIDTSQFVGPLDIKEINTSWLSSVLSTASRQAPELDGMLKRGEAQGFKIIKDITKALKQSRRGVTRAEKSNVDDLLRQLRDDVEHNSRTAPVTKAEFVSMYTTQFSGKLPSQKAIDYFKSLQDLNDVQYFIDADAILKQAIADGETMVKVGGVYHRARPVVPEPDAIVYTPHMNRTVLYSSLDPERVIVYEFKDLVDVPEIGFVQYIAGDDLKTRRLFQSDMLGYNAGGHRIYDSRLNFFVKQEDTITMSDGRVVTANAKTFMGVRTEKDARAAVQEWNDIVDAVAAGKPQAIVDDMVARAKFNLDLQNYDDFKAFADKQGLDVTKKINYAEDGKPLQGKPWAGIATEGQAFRAGLNRAKGRDTQPLIGYGGEQVATISPTQSILRSIPSAIAKRGDSRYMSNAVNGWLKTAQNAGIIDSSFGKGLTAVQRFRMAAEVVSGSKSEVAKALSKQAGVINNRLSLVDSATQLQDNFLTNIADAVYDKGWNKAGKTLDVLAQTDIAGFLRSVAFHTKLGLFAVDQLAVQASQIINIVGMKVFTNPIQAYQGFAMITPLRLGLINNLSPANLRAIGVAQSAVSGVSADDYVRLVTWIKSTGRDVVNRSAVEDLNSYAAIGKSSLLDHGQVFFNEGELIARLGAAAMNFIEVRTKDIFDNKVTDLMIRRQDVLTASMTSASAAGWQRSLLAVPLQFLTYQIRMFETLFTSKLISAKERVSLGLVLTATYGAAAWPFLGSKIDRAQYEGEMSSDSDVAKIIRYGMLDWGLSMLSGTETAMSGRLGIGDGFTDLYNNLMTQSLGETLAGPGGVIAYSIGSDFARALNTTFNPEKHNVLKADWLRLATNVTSINRGLGAWYAARYGHYISRRSEEVVFDNLEPSDAVLMAFGVPLEANERLWSYISMGQSDDKNLNDAIKEMERLDNLMARYLQEGDNNSATEMAGMIGDMLAPLTYREQQEALQRLRYTRASTAVIIEQMARAGKLEAALNLYRLTEGATK